MLLIYQRNIPGSLESSPCEGGCCERGPGVPPDPGDLTSSFTAPPYDNDDEGGRYNKNVSLIYIIQR